MNLKLVFSDISNTPFYAIPLKFINSIRVRFRNKIYFRKDLKKGSFNQKPYKSDGFIDFKLVSAASVDAAFCRFISEKIVSNELEVFGSKWSKIGFVQSINSSSIHQFLTKSINSSNLKYAFELTELIDLINPNYEYVNWSRDVISDYQFPTKDHFSTIQTIVDKEGVDVKNVWEIGRMHQLTLLIPSIITDEFNENDAILTNLKCKILDFILSNPPRFGIHWTSAMEVSIRLFNLSILKNLLSQYERTEIDSKILDILNASLIDHIDYAWEFKEHKNGLANNHFLANLLGLMYGSFSFKANKKYEAVFKKSTRLFWNELDKQFLEDGGNFESSTCYHVFSTEIAAIGLALCFKADKRKHFRIKEQVTDKTYKAVLKKMHLARILINDLKLENGEMPQLGDNDSARMFFMSYESKERHCVRNLLNYKSSSDIISTVLGYTVDASIHSSFFTSLMEGAFQYDSVKTAELITKEREGLDLKFKEVTKYNEFENENVNLKDRLKSTMYPNIGLYLFKSKSLYLLINGMNRHVKQYWPHGHNDKLSFELWVGGKPIVQDPGSLTYTGNPHMRNKYRSVNAHATAIFDNVEQNEWLQGISGVFRMIPRTKVELIAFEQSRIVLSLSFGKYKQVREFIINEAEILINDSANFPFTVNKFPKLDMSYGYGKTTLDL